MDERLQAVLAEGEVVRWNGRPEKSELLEEPYKKQLFLGWVIAAAIIVVMAILMLPHAFGDGEFRKEPLIALVCFSALVVFLAMQSALDKNRLENHALYAVTNHRLILMNKTELVSMPLEQELQAAVENRHNGCGNVCFAAAIGRPIHKCRNFRALSVRKDDVDKTVIGMTFYNVKDPDAVVQALQPAVV